MIKRHTYKEEKEFEVFTVTIPDPKNFEDYSEYFDRLARWVEDARKYYMVSKGSTVVEWRSKDSSLVIYDKDNDPLRDIFV